MLQDIKQEISGDSKISCPIQRYWEISGVVEKYRARYIETFNMRIQDDIPKYVDMSTLSLKLFHYIDNFESRYRNILRLNFSVMSILRYVGIESFRHVTTEISANQNISISGYVYIDVSRYVQYIPVCRIPHTDVYG